MGAGSGAMGELPRGTLEVARCNNWLLDIALDHLTLGRASLYRSVSDFLCMKESHL